MKKLLLILLALTMCVSMCACGGSQEEIKNDAEQSKTESSIETISIGSLLNALDNQAKAELNIGKQTTLFVKVNTIYSDYCEAWNVIKKGYSKMKIYMPKEELAKLEKDEYLAVSAIVDSIESNNGSFSYVFKDGEIQDMTLFDDYVREEISRYSSYDIVNEHTTFLEAYISKRGSSFKMNDDNEISTFIIGTWYRPLATGTYITLTGECTFHENGTVNWETWDSLWDEMKTYTNEWSVSDGDLDSFIYGGGYVYKINENVFVYGNTVFARK